MSLKPAPLWRDGLVCIVLITLGLFVGKVLMVALTRVPL